MAVSPKHRGYEARDVFKSAVSFNATCQYLMRVDHEAEPEMGAFIGHPYLALSALTIELLLKTLHAMQGPNPVPGYHHLGHLYRGLSTKTRNDIQRCWDPVFTVWQPRFEQMRRSYAPDSPALTPSVEEALNAGSAAFENNRYTFDQRERHASYYLDGLRMPLIKLILERDPSLAVWTLRATKVPWDDLKKRWGDPAKTSPTDVPPSQ